MNSHDVSTLLQQNGYAFLTRWKTDDSTFAIADSLGTVVNIDTLLPNVRVSTVHTLAPRCQSASHFNKYSGVFGLGEYPLHTDLAYWNRPPRYLLLRCQFGSPTVTTRLLTVHDLSHALSNTELRGALVRPRRPVLQESICLLPLLFRSSNITGIRWDPVFLVPMNDAAFRVGALMHSRANVWSKVLTLAEHGDTLILDNWRVLHGRSRVPSINRDRRLERVYLSEIFA